MIVPGMLVRPSVIAGINSVAAWRSFDAASVILWRLRRNQTGLVVAIHRHDEYWWYLVVGPDGNIGWIYGNWLEAC